MTDIDIPDGGVARVPTNGAKLGKTRRDEIFASRMGPVCRHLSSLLPLSLDEIHLLCSLNARQKERGPGATFNVDEKSATGTSFVLSGWACHQRLMCDGRRQILRVVLAGDAIGGHAETHAAAMDNIVALTPLTIIEVPDFALMAAPPRFHTNIGKAVALAVSRRELVLLDQILRLGCLTAFERMADLLLDLWRRLTVIGLADGRGFPLPLTQEVLADVLGLSIVHVNRTLQQLRRERLIDFCGGKVSLLNPGLLASIADGTASSARGHLIPQLRGARTGAAHSL
jgi:CRP-like cAMP-binding protein